MNKAHMLKNLARTSALLLTSTILMFILNTFGWIQTAEIIRALKSHTLWVIAAISGQISIALISVFKFKFALRGSKLSVSTGSAVTASFVSQFIGQWFSGSLAITEIARFAVIFGNSEETLDSDKKSSRLKIFSSSLFERVIGQATMLFCGGFAALGVLFFRTDPINTIAIWKVFIGISFVLGFGLFVLPFATRLRLLQHSFIQDWFLRLKYRLPNSFGNLTNILFKKIRNLSKALEETANGRTFLIQILMSILMWFTTSLTFYFNLRATNSSVSLLAVAASLPLMAIASIFPLGFAGLGGTQLVTVAFLSTLNNSPNEIAAGSLLSNGVTLIVHTLLGIIAIARSRKLFVELLRKANKSEKQTGFHK